MSPRISLQALASRKTRYSAALMLSGGKDSAYLAYQLVEKRQNVIAVTNDVGFMSDVAKDNISKIVEDSGIDHIWLRGDKSAHLQVIDYFRKIDDQGLQDVCGACTLLTTEKVIEFCLQNGIGRIISGFTPYSVGGPRSKRLTLTCGIVYERPYHDWYDLKHISEFLEGRGIVTDPTKTNCLYTKEIINTHTERFGVNPYLQEFSALLRDGHVTDEEFGNYRAWLLASP